jgi:hypothetical protein
MFKDSIWRGMYCFFAKYFETKQGLSRQYLRLQCSEQYMATTWMDGCDLVFVFGMDAQKDAMPCLS